MSPDQQERIIQESLQRLSQIRSAPTDPVAAFVLELRRDVYAPRAGLAALRRVAEEVDGRASDAACAEGNPLVYWRLRVRVAKLYLMHLTRWFGGSITADAESVRSELGLPLRSGQ